MRIVCLEPFLADLVFAFGKGNDVVGAIEGTEIPQDLLTVATLKRGPDSFHSKLSSRGVSLKDLQALRPELILTSAPGDDGQDPLLDGRLTQLVSDQLGFECKVHSFFPRTLNDIYSVFGQVSKRIGAGGEGDELARRLKAQLMDFGDNFYERMKNKRVTYLLGVDPFVLGGYWIPDFIHTCSAMSQVRIPGNPHETVGWKAIEDFRPDVIIVSLEGGTLEDSLKSFHALEKLPGWEDVPAVKRGEVVFVPPLLERIGPRLFPGLAILVSAIAGLESGYITKRDSFYRLRWAELNRHKI